MEPGTEIAASPSHELTRRPATEQELAPLRAEASPEVALWTFVTILFGILPSALLGSLGGFIGHSAGGRIGELVGAAIGVAIGIGIFAFAVQKHRATDRSRFRAKIRRELSHGGLHELHVTHARSVAVHPVSDRAPVFALDIGRDKVLLLSGDWLLDPATYGLPEDAEHEEHPGDLGIPEARFPSSDFTLWYWGVLGEAVRIQTRGNYLPPSSEVHALRLEHAFHEVEVLEGTLEDLPNLLEREHARRAATTR